MSELKTKRPLRINWIFAGANLAGGTKSNRLIAEAMVRRGHDVNLIYAMPLLEWPSVLRPRCFLKHTMHWWNDRHLPHHLMDSTAKIIQVSKPQLSAADVPDADVTIATFWKTREWIESWPSNKGIKAYFIRHHEILVGEPERVAATYRLPGVKLVIASWLKSLMTEQYEDPNAVLVPNAVDKKYFNAPKRSRQSPPVVGFMYSSVAWKRSSMAIEAIRLIQRSIPALQVVSFGSTPPPRGLMPKGCHYLLRPTPTEVANLCRSCDCWIVSSTSEGFGMPGIEAAACRCPIVATRCGGPEDYVVNGITGFLVPVNDVGAMANSITQVLTQSPEDWMRMSDASFQKAYEFDWDHSAELLDQTLESAIYSRNISGTNMQSGINLEGLVAEQSC